MGFFGCTPLATFIRNKRVCFLPVKNYVLLNIFSFSLKLHPFIIYRFFATIKKKYLYCNYDTAIQRQ